MTSTPIFAAAKEPASSPFFELNAQSLQGKTIEMKDYRGKTLVIVNTASECGLTPQYEGLEKLHQELKQKDLVILGFPCNQFGSQEPGTAEQIKSFCQLNYGVSFQLFSKIDVNGDKTHPIFQWLKKEAPGILGTERIKWNFTKFLVSFDGKNVKRYGPRTKPSAMRKDIEEDLKRL